MGDPPARFSHALCGRACFLPGAHLAMGLLNLHVTAEADGEGRDGSIVLPLVSTSQGRTPSGGKVGAAGLGPRLGIE